MVSYAVRRGKTCVFCHDLDKMAKLGTDLLVTSRLSTAEHWCIILDDRRVTKEKGLRKKISNGA
jgi:hypothetical protein